MIYEGEEGMDLRFSSPGFYGTGIYFAEDPAYSDCYSYFNKGINQMFLCAVAIGTYYDAGLPSAATREYRLPP